MKQNKDFFAILGGRSGRILVHFRLTRKRDLATVSLLERYSFEPISDALLKREMEEYHCYTMETASLHQVGFLIYEIFHGNILVRRLAVDSCQRRCGYGQKAMDWLKAKTTLGYFVEFRVNEYNVDAQLWLKKNGFAYSRTITRPKSDLYVLRWTNG